MVVSIREGSGSFPSTDRAVSKTASHSSAIDGSNDVSVLEAERLKSLLRGRSFNVEAIVDAHRRDTAIIAKTMRLVSSASGPEDFILLTPRFIAFSQRNEI